MGSVLSAKQSTDVPVGSGSSSSSSSNHTNGNSNTNGNANGSTPPKKLRVAVVGGGPGGLATAIALSKVPNVEVRVYEKDQVLREVGAGINIGPNSWNVLELLGVADSLDTGHQCTVVLNMNGRTGEELFRMDRPGDPEWPKGPWKSRPTIRTQRTALQSALLAHVPPGTIQLGKKLAKLTNVPGDGGGGDGNGDGSGGGRGVVELAFADGTAATADLVVGADGIRSVVRDAAWPDYEIAFTGTTIWRALLPLRDLTAQDGRFAHTGWWHLPTSHVYFSPVGEGLGEIAARETQDPAVHGASKVVWGVPVTNEHVESHFTNYLPQVQAALRKIPDGAWREFAAFAGPELDRLTAWDDKVILVGDSSHALSGAFGSGAGFAMEDGWVLAQALARSGNDAGRALPLFDRVRVPYYHRMYAHLADAAAQREAKLRALDEEKGKGKGRGEGPREEAEKTAPQHEGADPGTLGVADVEDEGERVKVKVIREGKDMGWIYQNNIGKVWESELARLAKDELVA